MNDQPHIHAVEVRRAYGNVGSTEVKYGDTTVTIPRTYYRLPSERRVKRYIRKAIRRHDRGSLKAGRNAAQLARLQAITTTNLPTDQWGSETIGR